MNKLNGNKPAVRILAAMTFLLLAFTLLSAGPATASPRAECRSVPSKLLGRKVQYCILLPPEL